MPTNWCCTIWRSVNQQAMHDLWNDHRYCLWTVQVTWLYVTWIVYCKCVLWVTLFIKLSVCLHLGCERFCVHNDYIIYWMRWKWVAHGGVFIQILFRWRNKIMEVFQNSVKNKDNRKNIIPLKAVTYNVAHIIIINSVIS